MLWIYEGIECYVSTKLRYGDIPLYCAWNDSDHLYTTSILEYETLPAAYKKEGIICYVRTYQQIGEEPLYRLYNKKDDDHLYCSSYAECNDAINKKDYIYEGIIGYVSRHNFPGSECLFRAWSPKIKDHFYTTDISQIDKESVVRSKTEIKKLLEKQLNTKLKNTQIYFSADNYFCPSELLVTKITNDVTNNLEKYTTRIHDSYDFAFILKDAFIKDIYYTNQRLMPYAMGIICDSVQAMNILIVSNDGVNYIIKLIDSRTAKIYDLNDVLSDIKIIIL